jgi:predicted MFS family arabinose efflux permease
MMFWTKDTVVIPDWNIVFLTIAIIGVVAATVVATCSPRETPPAESMETLSPWAASTLSSVDP